MIQGLLAHHGIRISERSEFVDLILKQVGINGPRAQPVLRRESMHFARARNASRQIPEHVDGDRRADSRPAMHLGRVPELLLDVSGRGRLKKFAEARAGVRKSPGG